MRRSFLTSYCKGFHLPYALIGAKAPQTFAKIEGGKVTIKDAMGGEKTVEPKNPEALTDLKVGDQVAVKDGMVTKAGDAGSSEPSPGKKY